jgi:hypothetical protein
MPTGAGAFTVTISGCVPTTYNGVNRSVTPTGTNTFTYALATDPGPVTTLGFAGQPWPKPGMQYSTMQRWLSMTADHFLMHQCYAMGIFEASSADNQVYYSVGGNHHCVRNCHMEAISECFIYGGALIAEPSLPRHITNHYNYYGKPTTWTRTYIGFKPKNHCETKCGNFIRHHDNLMMQNWNGSVGPQQATNIASSGRDQIAANNVAYTSTCPWNSVSDLAVFNNKIYCGGKPTGVLASADYNAVVHAVRVHVYNNQIFMKVRGWQANPQQALAGVMGINGLLADFIYENNTSIFCLPVQGFGTAGQTTGGSAFWQNRAGYNVGFTQGTYAAVADRWMIRNNYIYYQQGVRTDSTASNIIIQALPFISNNGNVPSGMPTLVAGAATNLTNSRFFNNYLAYQVSDVNATFISPGATNQASGNHGGGASLPLVAPQDAGFLQWVDATGLPGDSRPPPRASDWNITTGALATGGTDGLPIGATFP